MNIFNIVSLYKFTINGKKALVQATSLIDAFDILDKQGFTNYVYIGKV